MSSYKPVVFKGFMKVGTLPEQPELPGQPEIPELPEFPEEPEVPEQGPVLPGRPGRPIPRPPVPVVRAVPTPEDMEPPEGRPHEPGVYCIVYMGKANRRALGWLQGSSILPDPDTEPVEPGPGPKPELGGHWITVQTAAAECGEDDETSCSWAFVFEIDKDFGRPERPKRPK